MPEIKQRLIDLNLPPNRSAFLWGPRKVGKTYCLKQKFKDVPCLDLLQTDTFSEYASCPSLLRERFKKHQGLVIIDEIQKIPALLDEVHWLIENSAVHFILFQRSQTQACRFQPVGRSGLAAGDDTAVVS